MNGKLGALRCPFKNHDESKFFPVSSFKFTIGNFKCLQKIFTDRSVICFAASPNRSALNISCLIVTWNSKMKNEWKKLFFRVSWMKVNFYHFFAIKLEDEKKCFLHAMSNRNWIEIRDGRALCKFLIRASSLWLNIQIIQSLNWSFFQWAFSESEVSFCWLSILITSFQVLCLPLSRTGSSSRQLTICFGSFLIASLQRNVPLMASDLRQSQTHNKNQLKQNLQSQHERALRRTEKM